MLQSLSVTLPLRLAALLLFLLQCASAQVRAGFGGPGTGQVMWYLIGVRFSDGGTATGWLEYDYTTFQCSADITTTGGSGASGANYQTAILPHIFWVQAAVPGFGRFPPKMTSPGRHT